MKKCALLLLIALTLTTVVLASDDTTTDPATTPDRAKLGNGLIYSVNRTPERPFETARAVEVITAEDIWRSNAMSLTDILLEAPGFLKYRTTQSSVTGVVRGLVGRQVLILIDGVKVNDTLSGDVPNLDLIDVSQIERIEIVRGVVSVLGTESLGGVINIITRRAPGDGKAIGGTLGARFSSAANAFSSPISVHGQSDNFRWIAGVDYQRFGEMEGGKGVGVQKLTDYTQRATNLGFDSFVSADKMFSFSYHASEQQDVKSPPTMLAGLSLKTMVTPSRLQLGSLAYQDLTDRGWMQSFKATGYWNVQDAGTEDVRVKTPSVTSVFKDSDRLAGLNLELGSFLGSQHLVYGADYSRDNVGSYAKTINSATSTTTFSRGHYTDHAEYETLGIYAQDEFDLTKWATVTGGLRYGTFKTSGSENLPLIGHIDLDSNKSGLTSMFGVVFHAAPRLNVIANFVRGFRAPNLKDNSRFSLSTTGTSPTLEIPNPAVAAERITSYEGGVKYDSRFLSGSAFYFRNHLSNLLVVAAGTFNGQTFLDANQNGRRDPTEPSIRANQNIGTATIDGYEADVAVTPHPALTLFGNYSTSDASTSDVLQATLVSRVPPPFGSAGIRIAPRIAHAPWAEVVLTYTLAYKSAGVVLSEDFREYRVRGGLSLTDRWRIAISGENLNNQKYIARFTTIAYPGRRVIVGSDYRF
jgi:outer membrane receptor for ferrienterochelin and colicin